MPTSEELLLEQAKEFDLTALGELYDLYSTRIYNYIYHRVGHAATAEDLTTGVFLRMLEAIRSDKAWRTSFSGWLFRIAHNLVVDHYRSQKNKEHLQLDERLVAVQGEPEWEVEKEISRQELRKAINDLTEEQAQVVTLRFLEGLSVAEVADVLDKTAVAVRGLQYRAMVSLRCLLEEGA